MSVHCRTYLELPHLKDLQVLRSINVKGSFQNGAEEVNESQHTNPTHAVQMARLCWKKFKHKEVLREQNACCDTCNTDPIFYLIFVPVPNVSAFKNCHKPQQRGSVGSIRRIFFLKESFSGGFATRTPSDFECIFQFGSNTTDNLCLVLRNLEMQHYPRKQNVNFLCLL